MSNNIDEKIDNLSGKDKKEFFAEWNAVLSNYEDARHYGFKTRKEFSILSPEKVIVAKETLYKEMFLDK